MTAKSNNLGGFTLLRGPLQPGQCPECAEMHVPEQAHNQQSLFWQFHFMELHGRWPTWADALAHCTPRSARTGCASSPSTGSRSRPPPKVRRQTRRASAMFERVKEWTIPCPHCGRYVGLRIGRFSPAGPYNPKGSVYGCGCGQYLALEEVGAASIAGRWQDTEEVLGDGQAAQVRYLIPPHVGIEAINAAPFQRLP